MLPELWSKIFSFIGEYNEVKKLRVISKEFKKIISWKNIFQIKISKINIFLLKHKKLMEQIIVLSCNYNHLIELPQLPKCRELHCNYNQLTELPELPNCELLYCGDNRLTELPQLPNCDIYF
jgi:Leucine-rich repeat (LRR) protein